MEIVNFTPFPCMFFESIDKRKQPFGVFVVRATFAMKAGQWLKPHPQQEPVLTKDVFHGDPNHSSLQFESDLAPFKPASDIHLHATAYAPGGKPRRKWNVGVTVGRFSKELRVTGPRAWRSSIGLWQLSSPEATSEVPIRYELAFGGGPGKSGKGEVFQDNPVGLGYRPGLGGFNPVSATPAPQIESPSRPVAAFGKEYVPQGFGPLGRSWRSRLKKAGTYNQDWIKQRWPHLPEDFAFDFYNSAHPDLVVPGYLRGDEVVSLTNLRPNQEGPLRFRLPGYQVMNLLRRRNGSMEVVLANLDTLVLDIAARNEASLRVYATWRTTFGLAQPIRKIEARMETRANRLVEVNGG